MIKGSIEDNYLNLIEWEATEEAVFDVSGDKLEKFCQIISKSNIQELVCTPRITTELFNNYDMFHRAMKHNKDLVTYAITVKHIGWEEITSIIGQLNRTAAGPDKDKFYVSLIESCAVHKSLSLHIECDLTGNNSDFC